MQIGLPTVLSDAARSWWGLCSQFVVLLVCGFLLDQASIRFDSAILHGTEISPPTNADPLGEHNPNYARQYQIIARYIPSPIEQELTVTATDCVESISINGVALTEMGGVAFPLCNPAQSNSARTWRLALSPLLQSGENQIEVVTSRIQPQRGFIDVSAHFTRGIFEPWVLGYLAIALFFVAALLRSQGWDWLLIAVGQIGVILRAVYWSATEYGVRTFDLFEPGGHLDYIDYVRAHWLPPAVLDGWEYHQPPLYYYIAACLELDWLAIGAVDPFLAYQALSFTASLVFLYFGFETIKLYLTPGRARFLACLMLACWTAGIIHSIRIGPDGLFYALYAAGFFYIVRWYRHMNARDLWLAAFCGALALCTRSNALTLVAVQWALVAVRVMLVRTPAVPITTILAPLGIWILGAALGFASKVHSMLLMDSHWLLGGAASKLHPGLRVGAQLENFYLLDFSGYLSEPFISTWFDGSGRQYFWNFLLKSMLFSEFSFPGEIVALTARALAVVLLAIGVIGFVGFISRPRQWRAHLPIAIAVVIPVVMLAAYRYAIPYSCHNDFRFIFPALIPFVLLFCVTAEARSGWIGFCITALTTIVSVTFIALSITFNLAAVM